ncbi:MAG: enoyl-CoA hydratase/isomerase family protein [Thermoplasmata archaeon]
MSSNITTHGFHDISFWKEENIGLIVMRCDSKGRSRQSLFKELLQVVGIAYMDESVRSIAITGINEIFLREIMLEEKDGAAREFFDYAHALIRTIHSINKPVFSLVNGPAVGIGNEIALLSDAIISSSTAVMGFPPGYNFVLLGSLTSSRFGVRPVEPAKQGLNADYVIDHDNFMEDAKKKIHELDTLRYSLNRKMRLRGFEEAMLVEKDNYFSMPQGGITG